MKIVRMSGKVVFIPNSKAQVLALWFLSFFTRGYEKTYNPDAYPLGRRLSLEFNKHGVCKNEH